MAYEVRINRKTSEPMLLPRRRWSGARGDEERTADCEVEMIDTETGHAAEPGSSINWREELANKIGF